MTAAFATMVLAVADAPQARAESLIEEATRFTVKLRVSVEHPFIGERKGTSNGTGFLIDRQRGWIVTNAHMAKFSPSRIQVIFKDQAPSIGRKIYVDTHIDLAVVEVGQEHIPAWAIEGRLGCDQEAVPGQQVVAFGHPWSLDFTATRGIVSGRRFLNPSEAIQTDAAINPGNSGGALIDANTRKVIGINEASYGNERGSIGIAIPARLGCTIIELLKQGKDPSPTKLPATFATTTMDRELYVATVSGTWAATLRSGDRILAINGDRQHTYISRIIDQARGRQSIELTFSRSGKEHTATLEIPGERESAARRGIFVSGMLIGESPDAVAERDVLHVHFVDDASVAEIASLRRGDQIVSINGTPVSRLEQAQEILGQRRNEQAVLIVRRRALSSMSYTLHLRKLDIGPVRVID